jgi:predicted ATPase with chaperone activity
MIVGFPDAAVKESRDRVMTALINSGFDSTFGRTTINLVPADVKKEGPGFDLPIAVGGELEIPPAKVDVLGMCGTSAGCQAKVMRRSGRNGIE